MARFEAHITIDKQHASQVQCLAEDAAAGLSTDWVFSQITGCPILGQGTYCYLTAYDSDSRRLFERMNKIIFHLATLSIPVLRSKIEHIVYDTKTNINELAIN